MEVIEREIPIKEIYDNVRERVIEMSGYLKIEEDGKMEMVKEQYKEFLGYIMEVSKKLIIKVSMVQCGKEMDTLQKVLRLLVQNQIVNMEQVKQVEKSLFYAITVIENETKEEVEPLESLYKEMVITAYLDCGREWIRNYKKINRNSPNIGPGFFGIPLNLMREYCDICKGERIGLTVLENNNLLPKSSCVGNFLIGKEEIILKDACLTCKGTKGNCMFCGLDR